MCSHHALSCLCWTVNIWTMPRPNPLADGRLGPCQCLSEEWRKNLNHILMDPVWHPVAYIQCSSVTLSRPGACLLQKPHRLLSEKCIIFGGHRDGHNGRWAWRCVTMLSLQLTGDKYALREIRCGYWRSLRFGLNRCSCWWLWECVVRIPNLRMWHDSERI